MKSLHSKNKKRSLLKTSKILIKLIFRRIRILYHRTFTNIQYTNDLELLSNYPIQVLIDKGKIKKPLYKDNIIDKIKIIENYYPFVVLASPNSAIVEFVKGRQNRVGVSESSFFVELSNDTEIRESKRFFVVRDGCLHTNGKTFPYEPDIIIHDKNNIYIDVEIDEPYSGCDRILTHTTDDPRDYNRNLYFTCNGWHVIRFSEKQIVENSAECIGYIKHILNFILGEKIFTKDGFELNTLADRMWNSSQAETYNKMKYREKYLNKEDFNCNEREIVTIIKEEPSGSYNMMNRFCLNNPIDFLHTKNANRQNIFPTDEYRDKAILFDSETHSYFVQGKPFTSVTTFISKFFPVFRTEYWAEFKSKESTTSKTPDDFKKEWEEIAFKAAFLGTKLHEYIERRLKLLPCDEYHFPEKQMVDRFFMDHDALLGSQRDNLFPEWRIYDENYQVAGTIDLLIRNNNNTYSIYDWKRSKKIIDLNGNLILHNPYHQCKKPIESIPDTSYYKYVLQLNFYKFIAEKKYNLKISEMKMVVFHEFYNDYHVIDIPNYQDEIKKILRYYVKYFPF